MKKLVIFFATFIFTVNACAQLSILQVFQKSKEALQATKGFQANVTVKMIGIGETAFCEFNGENMRISQGEDVTYCNNKVEYDYEKKNNTLTIEKSEESIQMMLMPFIVIEGYNSTNAKDKKIENSKIEKKNNDYIISFTIDGNKMIFTINAKNYLLKEFKLKKSIVTLMSYSYSNLTAYKGKSNLKFDQTKYPTAKIIDNRNKK